MQLNNTGLQVPDVFFGALPALREAFSPDPRRAASVAMGPGAGTGAPQERCHCSMGCSGHQVWPPAPAASSGTGAACLQLPELQDLSLL